MAFTQSSSDALQVLNMLLVNKRREDISERQNALTEITIQLREVNVERDRELKKVGQIQNRLKEINSLIKKKRENFEVLSKIPKSQMGIKTDIEYAFNKLLPLVRNRRFVSSSKCKEPKKRSR